ncbi:unnamed protein product [Wuchereria bancrofti]|uniref:Uncharacterized protein n=1 Tax=Wuchereria bancrofti TaxID=6293 RepID=A0A3P7ER18_WUCBA|nr:unnamed protein product [Wuchereria bancrofti]
MSNLAHRERLYQFIKHKERFTKSLAIFKILKAKPVVESRPRSKSMPGRLKMSSQKQYNSLTVLQRDEERRIQAENERLLKSLLKISERKPKYF